MASGLFLSRDDGLISDSVDVEALAKAFSHLPVSLVLDNFFSYQNHQSILKAIGQHSLDGVVLAGNSPKYYESALGSGGIIEAIKELGINANKISIANIREQVAMPHHGDRECATRKAKLLIDVAFARLKHSRNIGSVTFTPMRSILIVGMTSAGIAAAQEFLKKDYRVFLVDRSGKMRISGVEKDLLPLITSIHSNKKAALFYNTSITQVAGWCGEYDIKLNTPQGDEEITVGGILIATNDDVEQNRELQPMLQLFLDDEGLPFSKHGTWFTGQTADSGVWYIPPAVFGLSLSEQINALRSPILSLLTLLDKNEISHLMKISRVNESVCGGCGTCVKNCPFGAITLDMIKKVSVVDPKRCKGCGNCWVSCPTGARDLEAFPVEYVLRAIEIMSAGVTRNGDPKILAILCNNCGYPAADTAGELAYKDDSFSYPPNVLPLRVECGASVDTQYILQAFAKGFDGVVVVTCKDGSCHYISGNIDMQRRASVFREVLRSRKIDNERLRRVIDISPDDGDQFSREINEFVAELKELSSAGEEV
jgi:heterodisulfide reductase subunit A-like polyferredoxin/coenzyme F420-reducing hydrogenase delta subunit